jgi:hypothetical protein
MPAQRPASMPAGLVIVRPSGPQECCSGAGILPALPSFQSTNACLADGSENRSENRSDPKTDLICFLTTLIRKQI